MYNYYATGDTESCTDFMRDWTKCLQARSDPDITKKNEILESTNIMYKKRELDAQKVWDFKDKPSW